MMSNIDFLFLRESESGVTCIWKVVVPNGTIGEIRWTPSKNSCYSFYPKRNARLNAPLMLEIAKFCNEMTAEYKSETELICTS
jgi:hypothetical protein